jgi:hypothetical protein
VISCDMYCDTRLFIVYLCWGDMSKQLTNIELSLYVQTPKAIAV